MTYEGLIHQQAASPLKKILTKIGNAQRELTRTYRRGYVNRNVTRLVGRQSLIRLTGAAVL